MATTDLKPSEADVAVVRVVQQGPAIRSLELPRDTILMVHEMALVDRTARVPEGLCQGSARPSY